MAEGYETLLTPGDDDFHPGADPWHTEGSWWSFCVPERRLGGWIYHLTRSNLGVASGGVWVWDERTHDCFDAPYFLNQLIQPLPAGKRDLNDFRWPDGVSLKTLEPLSRYRLAYSDGARLSLELEYRGVSAPFVSATGTPPKPFRLEQLCRVTGQLVLRGERIPIDCLALRDHSWGVRREQQLSAPGAPADPAALARRPVVYLYGHCSAEDGFFVMGAGGYLLREGRRVDLASVTQTPERDARGRVARIVIEGRDRDGRALRPEGRTLSCLLRPSNSGVALVHLVEWRIDRNTGYGELQDVWPYDLWATYRRVT
jgi:hypothetical protein